MLCGYLQDFEFSATGVSNADAMRQRIAKELVDLIVLELKLKSDDGMNVLTDLRTRSNVPVIILTSRKGDVDRIMALEFGADDYVSKPCSRRELLARIRAVLRRTQHRIDEPVVKQPRAYRFSDCELNLQTRRLTSLRGPIQLTPTEYALLNTFLRSPHQPLSREELLRLSTPLSHDVSHRSIDVQVLRLRRKIEAADANCPRLVMTERGVGYSFNAAVDVIV